MPLFFQQDIDESTKLAIWKIEEEEPFFNVPLQRAITHPHKRLQHLAGRYLLKYLFSDFPTELIRIADTRKPFLENEKYHFSISHCGDFAAVIVSSICRVGIDVEVISDKPARIMHKFLNEAERESVNPSLGDTVGQGESSIVNRETSNVKPGFLSTQLNYAGSNQNSPSNNVSNIDSNCINQDNSIQKQQLQTSNIKPLTIPEYQSQTPNPKLLTLCWSAKEAMFKWWGNGMIDFSEMLLLSGMNGNEEGMIEGRFFKDSFDITFPVHYKMFDGIVMAWVKTEPGVFEK